MLKAILLGLTLAVTPFAHASNDGALGDVFALYGDQFLETQKNVCLVRDLSNATATQDAWKQWQNGNQDALKALIDAREALQRTYAQQALDPKSSISAEERTITLTAFAGIATLVNGMALEQMNKLSEPQVGKACEELRQQLLAGSKDTAGMERIAASARKELERAEAGGKGQQK